MQIKQSALRIAAATTVTVFLAVGALGPVYATEDGADDKASSSQGEERSAEKRGESSGEKAGSDETSEETTSDDSDDTSTTSDDTSTTSEDTSSDEAGSTYDTGTTCNELGYTKIDKPSGSAELEFGTLDWAADTLNYEVNDGFTVDLCIKSGAQAPITEFVVTGQATGAKQIAQDISHIGYLVTEEGTDNEGSTGETEADTEAETEDEAGEEAAADESEPCDENATMEADGECVVPPVDGAEVAGTEAEVAGVEAEVAGVEAEASADRAPAEVASAAGVLPATGAGDYALILLAGLGLLAAGGVLLGRKRLQAGR